MRLTKSSVALLRASRTTLLLLFIAQTAICVLCSGAEEIPQPQRVFSGDERKPIEFVGRVVAILPSPMIWSGVLDTYQGVDYEVVKVVQGEIPPHKVRVFHALVGPPLCEKDTPVLSRELFKVGNTLQIKGERTSTGFYVCWEQKENVVLTVDSK